LLVGVQLGGQCRRRPFPLARFVEPVVRMSDRMLYVRRLQASVVAPGLVEPVDLRPFEAPRGGVGRHLVRGILLARPEGRNASMNSLIRRVKSSATLVPAK